MGARTRALPVIPTRRRRVFRDARYESPCRSSMTYVCPSNIAQLRGTIGGSRSTPARTTSCHALSGAVGGVRGVGTTVRAMMNPPACVASVFGLSHLARASRSCRARAEPLRVSPVRVRKSPSSERLAHCCDGGSPTVWMPVASRSSRLRWNSQVDEAHDRPVFTMNPDSLVLASSVEPGCDRVIGAVVRQHAQKR
jgi:hypothetical protein